MSEQKKGRIIGIGGIFFKSKDPRQLKLWYASHFGLAPDKYGVSFPIHLSEEGNKKSFTQWSPMPADTQYYKPSEKDFMINYMVENIDALVEELREKGVKIVDEMETYEYGKFIHVMDLEGNNIELWEPVFNYEFPEEEPLT